MIPVIMQTFFWLKKKIMIITKMGKILTNIIKGKHLQYKDKVCHKNRAEPLKEKQEYENARHITANSNDQHSSEKMLKCTASKKNTSLSTHEISHYTYQTDKIEMSDNIYCQQECRQKALLHCCQKCELLKNILESHLATSTKIKNTFTLCSNSFISENPFLRVKCALTYDYRSLRMFIATYFAMANINMQIGK